MTRRLLALSSAVLLAMILWPPYAAMYDPDGANLHSSIGYHPVWSPPTAREAQLLLYDRLSANPEVDRSALETMRAADPAVSVRVILNKVGLTFQVVLLLVVAASLAWISRRRTRRSQFAAAG